MGDDLLIIFSADLKYQPKIEEIRDWYAQYGFVVNTLKNYLTSATYESGSLYCDFLSKTYFSQGIMKTPNTQLSSNFFKKPWSDNLTQGDYQYLKNLLDSDGRLEVDEKFIRSIMNRHKSVAIRKYMYDFYLEVKNLQPMARKFFFSTKKVGTVTVDPNCFVRSYEGTITQQLFSDPIDDTMAKYAV